MNMLPYLIISFCLDCRYKSLFSYQPINADEIELMESDIVYVLEQCDDGWFVGVCERTGKFGTFPGNYVVPF